MDLFKSKQLALNAQIKTITSERDAALAQVKDLQGKLSESSGLADQVLVLTGERDAKALEITGLLGKIETLKAGAKTAEQLGSERALDITAAVSVPPVAKEMPAAGKLTGSALLSAYEAIEDPAERCAFLGKNKAAIYAAQSSR